MRGRSATKTNGGRIKRFKKSKDEVKIFDLSTDTHTDIYMNVCICVCIYIYIYIS